MVQNPPEGTPRLSPYLLVEDVDSELDWLVSTLGFSDSGRMKGPDRRSIHGAVRMGEALVMMGCPGPEYKNPKHRGGATVLTYIYVDDVDAHHAKARQNGADTASDPADQFYGDRTYSVEDPEGHQWVFSQHTRDVAPEDMHP